MHDSPFERDHCKGRSWEVFLYNPAPGVLYTRVMGHVDRPCVQILMGAFDRIASLTPDKIEVFHDWERVTGYEAEVRPEYTRWSKSHVDRLASVHVLIRSRILAMGITVANVALNGVITAHYERAEFEKLRAEAILRRRRTADAGPASGPTSSPTSSPTSGPTSGPLSRGPSSRPIASPSSSGPVSTSPSSAPPSGAGSSASSTSRSSDPSSTSPSSGPRSVRRIP